MCNTDIAPGAILSMVEFTTHIFLPAIFQIILNPSRTGTVQTGNGKSSSVPVRVLQDAQLWA